MSGSMSVAVSGGGGGYLFTAVQWQELEHQALIYKYLVAGVPVPSDLVLPIRISLQALSATFFNNLPTLGPYCSYYGKKFDPEPGRCRRTDGKKWRCSKDAYHESKYCEKHMHRGRNRSRKPVESQSNSKSLSTAVSQINDSRTGQSVTSSGSYDFGSNGSKLQMDTGPYVINDKDHRYSQGLTAIVNGQNYPSGGNMTNVNNSWGLIPTNSLLKPQNDSYSQNNLLQLNMANISESPEQVNHSMGPFLGQWPNRDAETRRYQAIQMGTKGQLRYLLEGQRWQMTKVANWS